MPMTRRGLATIAVLAAAASEAAAQGTTPAAPEPDTTVSESPFFGDKIEDESTADRTLWQGSLTSTTLYYGETADVAAPVADGGSGAQNASPFQRFFTDLRAQLDAKHIAGGRWDVRLDARGRFNQNPRQASVPPSGPPGGFPTRTQSGTFGGNELDLRELYAVRAGDSFDLFIGRQQVLDMAGIKIDGLRLAYAASETWTLFGFGGLYPVRGSRSITTDYPQGVDAMGNPAGVVMPIAAGAGAAYRTSLAYGSLGAGGILPLGDDKVAQGAEPPRVFVSDQGYLRRGQALDVFHLLVLDVAGADGVALTNGSLGVNWKPAERIHVTAAVHHVDTETLNVQAQTQLETPDPTMGVVQNNITVQRIASDSLRLGLSVGLGRLQRFEISTQAAVRRRPDVTVPDATGQPVVIAPEARGAELFLQAVDRRSILGLRIAASVARFFGFGDANVNKSQSVNARLAASREFGNGRGEWELEGGFIAAQDDNLGVVCDFAQLLTCYGSSSLTSVSGGGSIFYRLGSSWLAMASAQIATLSLTTTDNANGQVAQPPVLSTTGFLRIAYRF